MKYLPFTAQLVLLHALTQSPLVTAFDDTITTRIIYDSNGDVVSDSSSSMQSIIIAVVVSIFLLSILGCIFKRCSRSKVTQTNNQQQELNNHVTISIIPQTNTSEYLVQQNGTTAVVDQSPPPPYSAGNYRPANY